MFTICELLDDGFSQRAVRRLVQGGSLISLHAGVYRSASTPDGFETRCVAACLADPEVVVSGPAAARLWGFRHVHRPEVPEVLVSHDRTPMTKGVRIRRTNILGDEDRVRRDDGIVVATPARTWFDCAKYLGDERFEKLTEWVLDTHCSVPLLWREVRRMCGRGRQGSARVRLVMSQRESWQRPAGSGLEMDVFNALRERGIGPLVRQHPLRLPDGMVIHPDVAVVPLRWAVEVDHVTWHGGRFEAQRDKIRDRQARRLGWQVERVTDQELRDSFRRAVDDLEELFRLRHDQLRAA